MSGNLLRKYIDIINESSVEEKVNSPYAIGMAAAKKKYGYGEKPAHDLPKKVIKKAHEIAKKVDEKWDTETTVSPSERGKYEGKTLEELRKSYNALKASGPHPKGSTEYGRMKELAFAIRAKTGWGNV
mgnify:CR=1 FL=1